jgi:hypothetical protein
MLETDRITPNKALELLIANNAEMRQEYYAHFSVTTGKVICCAVGLPLLAAKGIEKTREISESFDLYGEVSTVLGLARSYLFALEEGFEDGPCPHTEDEWTKKGYEDGCRLREAVVDGTLPGEINKHTHRSTSSCVDNVVYGVVRPPHAHQEGALN